MTEEEIKRLALSWLTGADEEDCERFAREMKRLDCCEYHRTGGDPALSCGGDRG